MFRGVLFTAFASVFAASAVPAAEVPASAYLPPGVYAGAELKGFTARDAQPLYTDALEQGCSNAAGVDAALAKGPPSGNGVLLGTSDGRIVVSESIHAFPNAKAAKKFVTTARSSSGCVGYAGRDSMNRVFVQYPQLPPLPTFAPEPSRDPSTVSTTFEGTSAPAPLVGATALTTWDAFVAETSVRIAAPKPGELDPLLRNLLASVVYDGRSATGSAASPKLTQQADALAQNFLSRASSTAFGFQPSARTGVPANPSSCAPATDAFVFSGVHGAVRGFTGQDATTHVAARPELIVFARPADADRYLKSYGDLSRCFDDLYTSGLPAGSTVTVQRVPKGGTGSVSKSEGAKTVAYVSTLKGPDGAQLGKTTVEVITAGNRAAIVVGQVASPDTTVDIKAQLDALERDLGAVLSQK